MGVCALFGRSPERTDLVDHDRRREAHPEPSAPDPVRPAGRPVPRQPPVQRLRGVSHRHLRDSDVRPWTATTRRAPGPHGRAPFRRAAQGRWAVCRLGNLILDSPTRIRLRHRSSVPGATSDDSPRWRRPGPWPPPDGWVDWQSGPVGGTSQPVVRTYRLVSHRRATSAVRRRTGRSRARDCGSSFGLSWRRRPGRRSTRPASGDRDLVRVRRRAMSVQRLGPAGGRSADTVRRPSA
jgi:hypothetical protein